MNQHPLDIVNFVAGAKAFSQETTIEVSKSATCVIPCNYYKIGVITEYNDLFASKHL